MRVAITTSKEESVHQVVSNYCVVTALHTEQ